MTVATDLDAAPTAPADKPRRRWRRRVLIGVIGLVLLLSGGYVGWWEYGAHYQPLGRAGASAFGAVDLKTMGELNDGVINTRYVLRGPVGATGTVYYTLANNGRHDIRLLGYPKQAGPDFLRPTLRWSLFDRTNGDTVADARPFPVTIHAHQSFLLWFSVHQVDCSSVGGWTIDGIPLRWSAFGHNHVYNLKLETGGLNLPIEVCPHLGGSTGSR